MVTHRNVFEFFFASLQTADDDQSNLHKKLQVASPYHINLEYWIRIPVITCFWITFFKLTNRRRYADQVLKTRFSERGYFKKFSAYLWSYDEILLLYMRDVWYTKGEDTTNQIFFSSHNNMQSLKYAFNVFNLVNSSCFCHIKWVIVSWSNSDSWESTKREKMQKNIYSFVLLILEWIN